MPFFKMCIADVKLQGHTLYKSVLENVALGLGSGVALSPKQEATTENEEVVVKRQSVFPTSYRGLGRMNQLSLCYRAIWTTK